MLSYGVLRHHWQLQALIDALVRRPLRKRDSCINALLAIGLLQLRDLRIPDHAVVSETVEATRLLGKAEFAPLINAVLRRARREDWFARAPVTPEARYDHPQWLIDAIRADWPDCWEKILEANIARAPMWLRVNPRHATLSAYQEQLARIGIDSEPLPGAPQALRLVEPIAVSSLPGFTEGHVSVQDAAAQLPVPWLLAGSSRRVLDACAAPGGKSGQLLELGEGHIELTCIDVDAARLERLAENLGRLDLEAEEVNADACKPEDWWGNEQFDAILLDAPCSASGVIRRHPDIKLLRRPGDIEALAGKQGQMLDTLWRLLAPGGRLLYMTCSVLTAENDAIVSRFLAEHADARDTDVLHDNNIRDLMVAKACGLQVLPGTADLDGFYYAGLIKDC